MHNINYTFDVNVLPPGDRVIRLKNGYIIDPEEFNNFMKLNCEYIQYIVVAGNEKYYPLALIFPHLKLFLDTDFKGSLIEGCYYPKNMDAIGKCMTGCMRLVNNELDYQPDRIQRGVIINDESLFVNGAPIISDDDIITKYSNLIDDIYKGREILANNACYIDSKQIESF